MREGSTPKTKRLGEGQVDAGEAFATRTSLIDADGQSHSVGVDGPAVRCD